MKVSLVIADLNIRGGTHKQLIRLAEYLCSRGCDVSVHTFAFDLSRCYPEIVRFDVKHVHRKSDKCLLTGLFRSIVSSYRLVMGMPTDVDIINVHDLNCYSVLLLAKLLRRNAKLVWQINDLPYAYRVGPNKNIPPSWRHPIWRTAVWILAHLCDAVTVNAQKNKAAVAHLIGVDPELYYCGVDQISTSFLRRDLPTTTATPLRLLSIGVFLPYRNYEVILSAMDSLRSRGIRTNLTIVGATDRAPEYSSKIAAIAAEKSLDVTITGEIDEQQFQRVCAESHVFLFVNIDQSWGLAIFEAMNMSLPVIVSSSVGAVELLDGNTGVRVVDAKSPQAVAEAIEGVCGNPTAYSEMARAAFGYSRTLSWDKMYCPKVLALFHQLLATRCPTRASE